MKKDAGQIDQQKHMETFLTYKNSAMLSFSNQSKAIRISVLDHDFIDVAENIEKGSLKYTVGGQDGQDFVEDFKHLFPREVTEIFTNRTIAPAPANPPAAVLAPAPAPDPALASDPATVLASAPLNISAANQAHPPASEQHNSNETPAQNQTDDTSDQSTPPFPPENTVNSSSADQAHLSASVPEHFGSNSETHIQDQS